MFPVGSKGRDMTSIRMVAQQIKTIDFDNEFPVIGGGDNLEINTDSLPMATNTSLTARYASTLKNLRMNNTSRYRMAPLFGTQEKRAQ